METGRFSNQKNDNSRKNLVGDLFRHVIGSVVSPDNEMPVSETVYFLPLFEEFDRIGFVARERTILSRERDIEPAMLECGLEPDRRVAACFQGFTVCGNRPCAAAEAEYAGVMFGESEGQIFAFEKSILVDTIFIDYLRDPPILLLLNKMI